MKKIIITISLILFCLMNLSILVFAGGVGDSCNYTPCDPGLTCKQVDYNDVGKYIQSRCVPMIDALTQRPSSNVDAQALNALPDVSLEGGMTLAIKAMLRSAMYLTIIAIVVAAIYYIISRGKDEDMTKAKDIILYLVIGMAIIAAAYGIVSGVAQFNVFG